MFNRERSRKERSDKGKKRKPENDEHIQVRLNGNTSPREADAIEVWHDLVRRFQNNKRMAMREMLIDIGQRLNDGWKPAPPETTLSADVQDMLYRAMEVMNRLSQIDFTNTAVASQQVQQVQRDAQQFTFNATGMMGNATFFDEDD